MTSALVVDDSDFMRGHLKQILLGQGLATKVLECPDGIQALQLYMKYKPDIVTLDYVMPGYDGLKVAKEICHYDRNAKIIMVSGSGKDHVIENATASGVSAFIKKPFRPTEIKEAFDFVSAQVLQSKILLNQ